MSGSYYTLMLLSKFCCYHLFAVYYTHLNGVVFSHPGTVAAPVHHPAINPPPPSHFEPFSRFRMQSFSEKVAGTKENEKWGFFLFYF